MSRPHVQTQTSFSAGEISPKLAGRVDLALFRTALKTCRNFITEVEGVLTYRPGTRFVAEVRQSAKTARLVSFVFSTTQAFVIAFDDGKARFYLDAGTLLDGGVPFEIDTPFAEAELPALDFVQVGDVVYIAGDGSQPPRTLKRFDTLDWAVEDFPFRNGPFQDGNLDEAKTILASASGPIGATVTLTANGFTFAAGQVGQLVRLEDFDLSTVPEWIGGTAPDNSPITYAQGARVRVGDNVYEASSAGSLEAGVNAPRHAEGEWQAGPGKVTWLFLHDSFGVAQIVSVAPGGVTAQASVRKKLPESVVLGAGYKWTFGAWSTIDGFPKTVGAIEQRLIWAAGRRIWGSRTAAFDDYEAGADADQAFNFALVARNGQINDIAWLADIGRLAVGTSGAEFSVRASRLDEAITPTNVKATMGTSEGATTVQPLSVDARALFVAADRLRLIEWEPQIDIDSNAARDRTLRSSHITRPGIKRIVWQREPWRTCWCVLEDGRMAGFTYRPDEDFFAWHRHDTPGGFIEDAAVIPTADGRSQELYLLVRRTIAGQTKRYIERMEPPFVPHDATGVLKADARGAWYLDSALMREGDPATVISGLDHLEGLTVGVLADGAVHPDCLVTDGQIVLERAAMQVIAGLRYEGEVETLSPEFSIDEGTTVSRPRRVTEVTVRVRGSIGGRAGIAGEALDLLRPTGGGLMDAAPGLFDGVLEKTFASGWDTQRTVRIVQNLPLPMTVLAIAPRTEVAS